MDEARQDGDVAIYRDFDNRYLRHDRRLGIERSTLATLPVVDISPFVRGGDEAARDGAARALRQACIDIGFCYLKGHGFSKAEVDAVLDQGRRFFALPQAAKQTLVMTEGSGYVPPGGLNPGANRDKAADMKERFYFAREFALSEAERAVYPPPHHLWPDESAMPGFRPFVTDFTAKSVALTQKLGFALARSLDLDEGYFERENGRFGGTLVFNYYPPLDRDTIDPTQWSFSPHTDYGSFTLVFQDALGGLQVRNAAGAWIDVVPVPDTLIFNIGDLFALATNDLYTSNLHRVANFNDRDRVSVTLFVGPGSDAEIRCIETCQGPENPPRYAPVNAGEYTRALLEQYHRTGRPGIAPQTARRFQRR
ncbi:MAG TPA: 2-oxoglutarate and iron-dependent oxygenase domain-containing protein [Stellaceae bacterium]|nr:2-oxoglutarate and iron-dependent oxygenase domain-containing protein [Stellaceae bacterium]